MLIKDAVVSCLVVITAKVILWAKRMHAVTTDVRMGFLERVHPS